jgi:FecR protein
MVLVILLPLNPTISNADVGKVTEQTGPTEIKRAGSVVSSAVQSEVEMNDTVTTANGKAGITFRDDTKVQITEHSKLVIDNFVYDDSKKTGKLGIKMALGTIKYASGQIAKSDPQQVVVETPTATIGVRGTDFSGTVDEIGRSTVILLPSCPVGWRNVERDCITGSISVTTDMGTIWLTKPFESVAVGNRMTTPKSAILNLNLDQINNLIIVTPPRQVVQQETTATKAYNFLDEDLLGQDLLVYGELSKDYLKDYNKLDRNYLDSDFLYNLLDISSSQLLGNELVEFNGLLPKYNAATGLKYFVENDYVTLYRETSSSYAEVKVSTNNSLTLNITQENIMITQMVNSAGTTTINIKQGN